MRRATPSSTVGFIDRRGSLFGGLLALGLAGVLRLLRLLRLLLLTLKTRHVIIVFLILIIFSARNGTAAQLGEVDAAEVVSAA